MDYQLQLINSLPLLKKLYSRRPAAAALESVYCAICLHDVGGGGDSYRKLDECGHCFHAECIGAWLKSHSTCPLCRTQIIEIDYRFGDVISNIVSLFHNFVEKMCNPLNDALASMLCAASLS